jgi:hypothetical protein
MPLIRPETYAMMAHVNRKDSTHGESPEASAFRMIGYLKEAYPEIGTQHLTDETADVDKALIAHESQAQGSLIEYLTRLASHEELHNAPNHQSISGTVKLAQAILNLEVYTDEEKRQIFIEMSRIAGMAPGICIAKDSGRDKGWDEHRKRWSTNRFYDRVSGKEKSCITSPAEALNRVAKALLDRSRFQAASEHAEEDERLRLFSFAGRMLELWRERQNGQQERCSAGIQHELLFLLNGIYLVDGKPIDLPVDTDSFLLNSLSEALAEELKHIEAPQKYLDLIWSWLKHREGLESGDDSPLIAYLRMCYPEKLDPDKEWKAYFKTCLQNQCALFGLNPERCEAQIVATVDALEYIAVPGNKQVVCLNQLMSLKPLSRVSEGSVMQPLVAAANQELERLKQGSNCPDEEHVEQWLKVWEIAQSLHAFHAVAMFSGVDKETTVFDQSRQTLSSILLNYFHSQPLPAEFEVISQNFMTQLAAFKASRHEEFVRNFFMLVIQEDRWNQAIWEQMQTLSLSSSTHPLILDGGTLTRWAEQYRNAEGGVDLSTYEINRILMQPLLVPPASWGNELRIALNLVSTWLLEPVREDNASTRALKQAFPTHFLCNIKTLLCVLNSDTPRLPEGLTLDSFLTSPLFFKLMQQNNELLPQFFEILKAHWGKIILHTRILKALLAVPELNNEQRREIWLAVIGYRNNVVSFILQDPTFLFYPFVDIQLLNQPLIGEGVYKGITPFLGFCISAKGAQLLRDKWDFFADKITPETLNQVIAGEGPNQGMTPFYWFCRSIEGRKLLKEKWSFLMDKVIPETLNQVITGKGSNQGMTPFYLLCASPDGRQLLQEQWGYFSGTLTSETLNQVVTGEGPNQGMTPVYWLSVFPEGQQLLRMHWDYFMDKLTPEVLNQVVTGEGPNQGMTPFYLLCASLEGQQLLQEKWDFFADKLTPVTRQKMGVNQINFLHSLETNNSGRKRERVTFFATGFEELTQSKDSYSDYNYDENPKLRSNF